MTEVTADLARFVADTPADAIPATVREMAVNTLTDTVATARAGVVEDAAAVLREWALATAPGGGARVLGSGGDRAQAGAAALANGAAAHALDFDSISVAVSGFVGSAAACALTALVEQEGERSARDVITAYVLGWEAAAAVARGVNIYHYAHGWHPSSTLSHFAAACACARLAGLDAEATRMAIGVATSEASGVKTMVGNMINPFHIGKAARNGLTAVDLVRRGFVAHPSALEADQGFLNVFNGPEHSDPDAIVAGLGQRWDLADPGPIFKVYPCCGLIHSGIDAALALREEHALVPQEILSVRVLVHQYVPRVMRIDVPEHGYAAKFSIPYCIAAALQDGRVDLATFDQVDPAVVELGRRVAPAVHPDLAGPDAFLEREFTEIEIETGRGTFTRRVQRMHNRGTGANLRLDDLRAKHTDCLRHGGAEPSTAEPEWDRLRALDSDRPWDLWGAQ